MDHFLYRINGKHQKHGYFFNLSSVDNLINEVDGTVDVKVVDGKRRHKLVLDVFGEFFQFGLFGNSKLFHVGIYDSIYIDFKD